MDEKVKTVPELEARRDKVQHKRARLILLLAILAGVALVVALVYSYKG